MKGEKGNCVNLVVSGGQKWRVGFVVKRKDWFFNKGWKAFLKGNAVSSFDFLVFRYLGSMAFHVTIFGPNGCAKLSASSGDLPKAVGVDTEKRRQNRQNLFKRVQMGSEKRGPGRHHVFTPAEQKAADSFTSSLPFFVKTLAWKSKQSPIMVTSICLLSNLVHL
uniref:TF-B3 domain-containing protein n=1 Tax=Kalanchoe fedtschenkoi TaxID=63787 RepID=A0A7N0R8P2_KALFE